jgi:hypothetical protein
MVEVRLGDRWRVERVLGSLAEEDKQVRLTSYEEERSQSTSLFMFPRAELVQFPEALGVQGSALWSGPIPTTGFVGTCVARLSDASGSTVYEGSVLQPLQLGVPPVERGRSGGVESIQVPDRFSDVPDLSAEIVCDTFPLDGWKPTGEPRLTFEDETHALVSTDLVWSGPAFERSLTRCIVKVRDESGTEIGEERSDVGGASFEALEGSNPTYRPLTVSVLIPPGRGELSATVECTLLLM